MTLTARLEKNIILKLLMNNSNEEKRTMFCSLKHLAIVLLLKILQNHERYKNDHQNDFSTDQHQNDSKQQSNNTLS